MVVTSQIHMFICVFFCEKMVWKGSNRFLRTLLNRFGK